MARYQRPSNSSVDAPTTSVFRCNDGVPLVSRGRGGNKGGGGNIGNKKAIKPPAAAPTPADVRVALIVSREPQKVSQRNRATNCHGRGKIPRDSRVKDEANDACDEPEQQKG